MAQFSFRPGSYVVGPAVLPKEAAFRDNFGPLPNSVIPLSNPNYQPLRTESLAVVQGIDNTISSIFNTIHQDIRDAVGGANQNVRDLVGGLNRNLRDAVGGANQNLRDVVGGLNKDAGSAGSALQKEADKALNIVPIIALVGVGALALLLLTDNGGKVINAGGQLVNAGVRLAAV